MRRRIWRTTNCYNNRLGFASSLLIGPNQALRMGETNTMEERDNESSKLPAEPGELPAEPSNLPTVAPTCHLSVMLPEVLEYLAPGEGKTIVDGTLGGGGHSRAILAKLGDRGLLLSLDRDPIALARCSDLCQLGNARLIHANFAKLALVLESEKVATVDGVLVDLGLSSDQLEDDHRGFSFDSHGEFDLRFDVERGDPAWRLLARLSEADLADLIFTYGEERLSRRIARSIVHRRQVGALTRAKDVADLVRRCYPPPKPGERHRIDPATRTFQALRIAVNGELDAIQSLMSSLPLLLTPGGRAVVISFHSLEDRIVKQAFRSDTRWDVLTPKPVTPSEAELTTNPRSRSAKLRAAIWRP